MYLTWSHLVKAESHSDQCHPWSCNSSSDTLQDCQYYVKPKHPCTVLCLGKKILMSLKQPCCVTNDGEGTFIGYCQTFTTNFNVTVTVLDGTYIQLPKNISELSDYMCRPMNRKGRVCSECIDGFAPSVTSIGYECSNCTEAWYGVPLYLFLEFVPVTVFYLVILVFQISVTSAPMTCCLMYCQLMVTFTVVNYKPYFILESSSVYTVLVNILIVFHSIWNLDFFRYIVSPFCVSSNLKSIHILFLDYISAVYPLVLIILTWVCIQLHSYNHKPLVWLWNKLSYLYTKRDSKSTTIDVFATFFLLSYTKLLLTSMFTFNRCSIFQANSSQSYSVLYYDTSVYYFSNEHIPYVIIAALVLLLSGLLPALLLAIYPVRIFRSLLLNRILGGYSRTALNIFVEKFYNCYRDGLDGGRDMRSFASLHLFTRMIAFVVATHSWMYLAFLFGVCCLLTALVRPYKKTYMNIIDALILALLSLNCIQTSSFFSASFRSADAEFQLWNLAVTSCFPLLVIFFSVFPCKSLLKAMKQNLSIRKKLCCIKDAEMHTNQVSDDHSHDSGRIENPEKHSGEAKDGSCEGDPLLRESERVLKPVYFSIN